MRIGRIIAVALIASAPGLVAAAVPSFESMPTLDAATLAPAALLGGPGYSVESKVPVVGYMGQFTLKAPAGMFPADGAEMLAIRISELTAIAKASQLSQSGVFADALAASAKKTGAALGQAAMNPVATAQGVPAGVGRFLQSATKTVSRATESAVSAGSSNAPSASEAAMDVVGVNKAKRQIAKQVGADPYTTNPVLVKQLDDLAQAAFAGGVSLDAALAVSTAGVATAISATATVSNLVWDKSPADIRSINEQKLAAMGVSPAAVRAFVTNRWFTPTLSVPFVEHLARMPGAKGRAEVVALASTVASETEARFMLNGVAMTSLVGTEQDPVVAIKTDRRVLVAQTRRGRIAVPVPVDYVVWSERVSAFAGKNPKAGQRTFLITGTASDRARKEMQALGWTVEEHSKR